MGKFNKHANTNLFYMVFDVLYGVIAYIIATLIYSGGRSLFNPYQLVLCLCFIVVYIASNNNKKLYSTTLFFYVDRIVSYITRSFIFTSVLVCLLAFFVGEAGQVVHVKFFIIFLIADYILMLVSAFLTRAISKSAGLFYQNTLFVGTEERYERVVRFLHKNNMGIDLKGYVVEGDAPMEGDTTEYIGKIADLEQLIHEHSIDQVFFMQHRENPVDFSEYISLCLTLGVTVRLLHHPYRMGNVQNFVCSIGTYPMVTYHRVVMDVYARALKRTFDIVASILGIIIASPIMLITAIAIKLETPGPVIFKQERVGKNGRHFFMYKFRSMVQNADELKAQLQEQNQVDEGFMFKIKDDPRITKVGKFIRKTSIDELPQFFNVLTGSMSLVGTRPPTLDEVAKYETVHWRRLSIRPGITGMWQVSGRSTITDFDEVVALDTEYIDSWSLWLDLKILFKTVFQVVGKKTGAF